MTDDLIAALLKERFGGPITRSEARRGPLPYPDAGDGGPDTELAIRRRQRDLCDALDAPRKRAAA